MAAYIDAVCTANFEVMEEVSRTYLSIPPLGMIILICVYLRWFRLLTPRGTKGRQ
jgi:hypothetical protein